MIKEKLRLTKLKNIHFLNPTSKQFLRSQPPYSEDEDYFHQIQQPYKNNKRKKNNWNIVDQLDDNFQPDIFEPYIISHETEFGTT